MKTKRIVILTFVVFILTMFIFPVILHCSGVKQLIVALLSFTENKEYKVAYVEFAGAIIGSFIAICGSVWIQSKVDEKEATDRRKKYACIVYNDLDLAFKDLTRIFRDIEIKHGLKDINGEEAVNVFCEVAVGRKIHLSPNWISDVAQLNNVLSRTDIQTIYKYYGLFIEIDYALQSGNPEAVKEVYSSHIGYLVSGNQGKVYRDCQNVLDRLKSLI